MTKPQPTSAEDLPSIDDLFGADEAAATLAHAAATVALTARRLHHQRKQNGDGETDPIQGFRPEADGDYTAKQGELVGDYEAKRGDRFRTYAQQRKIAQKALADLMKQASEESDIAKVKELTQQKIKEALEREQKLLDARVAQGAREG